MGRLCSRNLTGDCRPSSLTCLQPWLRPLRLSRMTDSLDHLRRREGKREPEQERLSGRRVRGARTARTSRSSSGAAAHRGRLRSTRKAPAMRSLSRKAATALDRRRFRESTFYDVGSMALRRICQGSRISVSYNTQCFRTLIFQMILDTLDT